ncbi:hypothetical protein ACIGG9_11630 [Pseudonocardia alni]|uniref:hypothetical protein n=1 Tax=Pseudonocardia alni TaxID=33907 RepID=UPI0033D75075
MIDINCAWHGHAAGELEEVLTFRKNLYSDVVAVVVTNCAEGDTTFTSVRDHGNGRITIDTMRGVA